MRLILAALLLLAPVPQEKRRPLIGAIRWDAWTGGKITAEVERSLGPKKYHFRLPFFARVVSETQVEIRGGTPDVMDREIACAADAGIDYWAFVMYPEPSELSTALKNYLASRRKDRIRFCMILHGQISGSEETWSAELQRCVRLMKDPSYQTVLDRRPLAFLFNTNLDAAKFGKRFVQLREAVRGAGLQDPYLVYMGFHPRNDQATAKRLGFDALSAYAIGGEGPYKDLTRRVETQYWNAARDLDAQVIPLATAGWDKRPRMDHPVSWELDHAYHKDRKFVETATAPEIADHLKRALEWTEREAKACPARTVILYGWNENDEGGWVVPTLNPDGSPNTERLDAIRKMLSGR